MIKEKIKSLLSRLNNLESNVYKKSDTYTKSEINNAIDSHAVEFRSLTGVNKGIFTASLGCDSSTGYSLKFKMDSYSSTKLLCFTRYGLSLIYVDSASVTGNLSNLKIVDLVGTHGYTATTSDNILTIKTNAWETLEIIGSSHSSLSIV